MGYLIDGRVGHELFSCDMKAPIVVGKHRSVVVHVDEFDGHRNRRKPARIQGRVVTRHHGDVYFRCDLAV